MRRLLAESGPPRHRELCGGHGLSGRQTVECPRCGERGSDAGQVLRTDIGKAEVLLTPGVFLRLGDHSAVKMISPDLTRTQVEVVQGRVAVEVDEIHPQNNLQVVVAGVPTQLMKTATTSSTPATQRQWCSRAGRGESRRWKVQNGERPSRIALAAGGPEKRSDSTRCGEGRSL